MAKGRRCSTDGCGGSRNGKSRKLSSRQGALESRMTLKGSCPVVCPGKVGMFSRRQTCRGKSQSPVVWIAEVMETETLKPIDEISLGEVTSHRPVTKVNALWPRKGGAPRAEPATGGRRQQEQPKSDRRGCSPWRGGSDSTVTR